MGYEHEAQPEKELPPPPPPPHRIGRKPVAAHPSSASPGNDSPRASIKSPSSDGHSTTPSRDIGTPDTGSLRGSLRGSEASIPVTQTISRQREIHQVSESLQRSHQAEISQVSSFDGLQQNLGSALEGSADQNAKGKNGIPSDGNQAPEMYPQLQYHHQPFDDAPKKQERDSRSTFHSSNSGRQNSHLSTGSIQENGQGLQVPRTTLPRPSSAHTLGSDLNMRGREQSPRLSMGGSIGGSGSPVYDTLRADSRTFSGNRRSPEGRPASYVDLLNVPYPQQVAPVPNMDNSVLRQAVGGGASLMDTNKTLEMYRANAKKTNDPAVLYEFAVFLVELAQRTGLSEQSLTDASRRNDILREARQILQRLADRSYPFAQYYLGDGYASGLFNKNKEDYDRAFPLFVAASKHGHAESGYRAALCYEFGWGCRRDFAKAVQFYRASASKNHPGAATRLGSACLEGSMGLVNRYREGVKWLKRAAESADFQYNSAPYELGRLHESGYGDDVFKDEAYAAQLYTKSADLGHPEANFIMGKAYEHGLLSCPKDPALSIHFYNGAAQKEHPEAMMALCAWYLFGAEPILSKDENEAFEWALRAANHGFPKAEYAVGYFKEMGIGCRQDTLEANVWYVRAADQGDEKAKQRLAIIRTAASGGDPSVPSAIDKAKDRKGLFGKLGFK